MNNKQVIENREFCFHPTCVEYAASLDGYVVHAITRILTVGVINEKEYSEFTVEDDWRRSLYVHDFIWD